MKNQQKQLEEFWLEIGENSIKIDTILMHHHYSWITILH